MGVQVLSLWQTAVEEGVCFTPYYTALYNATYPALKVVSFQENEMMYMYVCGGNKIDTLSSLKYEFLFHTRHVNISVKKKLQFIQNSISNKFILERNLF